MIRATIATAAVLACLGAATYAVAATDDGSSTSASSGVGLSVFASASKAHDQKAAGAFEAMEKLSSKDLRIEDAVVVSRSTEQIFVAKGPEQVCMYIKSASDPNAGGCTSLDSLVAAGRPAIINRGIGTKGDAQLRVTALFPDGATNARLTTDSGGQTAEISGNIASFTVRGTPKSLDWSDRGSPRRFEYPS